MHLPSSHRPVSRIAIFVVLAVASASGDARDRATDASLAPVPSSSSPAISGVPVLPVPLDIGTRTLRVGPALEFTTPSAAAAVARDGDTVEIASGDYRGDAAVWTANRLRIVGGDPRPHISADGKEVQGKGLWLIRGDDIVVENVELSGARVPDRNGAAIRLEGRNFVLRNSYLHDNENGLLTGANATSEIAIDHCEFARNGGGEGMTHNLYVGNVAKLTVTNSYLHHAIVGHNLKSRAKVTVVSDSRLADEADGRASYEADFPNGGRVTLAFNIFQKGASAENPTLVSYGAEGLSADGTHELIAKGNTFISQRPNGARFLFVAPATQATVNGNVFAGPGVLPDVAAVKSNNAVQRDLPGNVDLKPPGF